MRQPRSYIVRIHRQGARSLTGVVEDTRTGTQLPFSSIQNLWSLLRRSSPGMTNSRAEKDPV